MAGYRTNMHFVMGGIMLKCMTEMLCLRETSQRDKFCWDENKQGCPMRHKVCRQGLFWVTLKK